MTTTDHAAEAQSVADVSAHAEFALQWYAYAQVHATLALAAEQRTANQLALLEHLPPHSPLRDALRDHVISALTEDVTP